MDRGSSSWPGGPVEPSPYPHERMGGKYPPHEVGQQLVETKKRMLVRADITTGSEVFSATKRVWVNVPDSRLLCSLTILFEPYQPVAVPPTPFQNSTVHLCSTVDCGFGPREVEDLLGTRAAPWAMRCEGLYGWQYSPTEEVEGMVADLVLGYPSGYAAGAWWAVARWQALRPMTHVEWVAAVARCELMVSPGDVPRINYGPPG